jgi:Cu/Zn superoxide dismutase
MITGINGIVVTGSATFTQGATMTKLVLSLTACPDGPHSSHLHLVKDCSDNGAAAGGHWVPNGEKLGDYSCASGMVTYEVSKPVSTWTVGDGSATDVTKYAFMVHETSDAMSSGSRIGCGVINKQ